MKGDIGLHRINRVDFINDLWNATEIVLKIELLQLPPTSTLLPMKYLCTLR